jgi:hypothetical protein
MAEHKGTRIDYNEWWRGRIRPERPDPRRWAAPPVGRGVAEPIMSEVVDRNDWPWITAWEALSLIAFGRVDFGRYDLPPWEEKVVDRWGVRCWNHSLDRRFPLVIDIRYVLARVGWWQMGHRDTRRGRRSLPSIGVERRAHIRKLALHYKKPIPVLLAELRIDIQEAATARAKWECSINAAIVTLCREVAGEQISAEGRRGLWRNRQMKTGLPETIPAKFFANRDRTITVDGWATCDPESEEWITWKGPDWGDVRFKRGEILTIVRGLFGHAEIKFRGGYISPLFISNEVLGNVELRNPDILVYQKTLSDDSSTLVPFLAG